MLKVISSTPGNLEPVFNAMLANATRICEAKFGNLFLYEGGDFRSVAVRGDFYYEDWYRKDPLARVSSQPGAPLARLLSTKTIVHIHDLRLDEVIEAAIPA